jgi:integrative and conjugative element protein (TIGR02256 family)
VNPQRVHRVRVSESALATIRYEATRSSDGNETGGILLGHVHPDGTAEVRHAGDPGPVAVRRPTFFLRDLHHAQQLAAEAFDRDGSVWIGEWHTHPTTAPIPSDRDLDTYARLLADPDLQFHVIISMIISASDHLWDAPISRAWACYPDRAEPVPMVLDAHTHPARTR